MVTDSPQLDSCITSVALGMASSYDAKIMPYATKNLSLLDRFLIECFSEEI